MNFSKIRFWIYLAIYFLSSPLFKEDFHLFLNDQRGGLILPIDGIPLDDLDWIKYKSLKVDKSLKSIDFNDLPNEFCDNVCEVIEEFRRKTLNLDDEWMLYFDYSTGDIIYCFEGAGGHVGGIYDIKNFQNRKIASIHNHPKNFYSFPSHGNFELLEKDFEDYELICSINAMWIIEFKGILEKNKRFKLHYDLNRMFKIIEMYIKVNYSENVVVGNIVEEMYGEYLLSYLNNNYEKIKISKKEN